jgi:hypothetical protein
MTAAASPQIHLKRDGPFFRVRVEPVGSLPSSIHAAETYTGHPSANTAAKLLSAATGFRIIDHTKGER